jgi:hypothetical protein
MKIGLSLSKWSSEVGGTTWIRRESHSFPSKVTEKPARDQQTLAT